MRDLLKLADEQPLQCMLACSCVRLDFASEVQQCYVRLPVYATDGAKRGARAAGFDGYPDVMVLGGNSGGPTSRS